jgi:outer membrane protein assembly factor BamE (lipoprotein component of BamABCDE complex)
VKRLLALTLALAFAGCSSEAGDQAEPNRHSISPQQYERVKVGMSRWVVRGLLGDPADDQDMEIEAWMRPAFKADDPCIYYMEQYRVGRNEHGDITSGYQFCFDDDDRLESKAPSSEGSEAEEAGIEPLEEEQ